MIDNLSRAYWLRLVHVYDTYLLYLLTRQMPIMSPVSIPRAQGTFVT